MKRLGKERGGGGKGREEVREESSHLFPSSWYDTQQLPNVCLQWELSQNRYIGTNFLKNGNGHRCQVQFHELGWNVDPRGEFLRAVSAGEVLMIQAMGLLSISWGAQEGGVVLSIRGAERDVEVQEGEEGGEGGQKIVQPSQIDLVEDNNFSGTDKIGDEQVKMDMCV